MHDLEQLQFEGAEAIAGAPRLRTIDREGVPIEAESPLDEVDEMELASDLLEVSDEFALNRIVAKLLKAGFRGLGPADVPPAATKQLGSIVKQAIKKAIPTLAASVTLSPPLCQ